MGFGGNPTSDLYPWLALICMVPVWLAIVLVILTIAAIKTRRGASAFWRWLPIGIPIGSMPFLVGLLLLQSFRPMPEYGLIACVVLIGFFAAMAVRLKAENEPTK